MYRYNLLLLLLTISILSFSQEKKELASDDNIKISYVVSKKEVKFYITTNGGSPSIKVDVNKNGSIDDMVDRGYGLAGGQGMTLCAYYLVDATTTTVCGKAPSKAKLSGKVFDYIFTIPKGEFTTPINPDEIHVMISLFTTENGKNFYRYYPSGTRDGQIFKYVYEIDIK